MNYPTLLALTRSLRVGLPGSATRFFTDGREPPGPWGRANPRFVIDETELDKQTVEYQLRRLRDAGWIRNIARGLYEFVEDPRER